VEAEAWWVTLEEHASKSKRLKESPFNYGGGLSSLFLLNGNDMHLLEIYEQTRICFSSVAL